MSNPFQLRWLQGWNFLIVFMEGKVQIEGQGFGICIRTPLLPGESPRSAADRLVLVEDQRRKSLRNSWIRGKDIAQKFDRPLTQLDQDKTDQPNTVVVVNHDFPVAV